jgi:hypothetical protein
LEISTLAAPVAKIHWASRRGRSQAAKYAPRVPNIPKGVQLIAKERVLHWQRIFCHAMYQRRVLKDMKQSKVARTRGRNEGAFQMSRGAMGDLSNLDSQIVKIASIRIDNRTRTIS